MVSAPGAPGCSGFKTICACGKIVDIRSDGTDWRYTEHDNPQWKVQCYMSGLRWDPT